ncbi:MAG: 30S ribosomal protein S16 [Pirellulales bacterium]|nr:30S ribosomal protein S16 [Pirellulales bacterium]
MKKMGRAHRAFFRICATDKRAPRDGRVLEELGTYDPSVPETDARAQFNQERVAHWLSVGALPSEKVAILIKKYGPNGTHLEQQKTAIDKLKAPKTVPQPGPAAPSRKKQIEEAAAAAKAAEEAAAAKAAEEAAAQGASEEAAEGPGEGDSSATAPAESSEKPVEG